MKNVIKFNDDYPKLWGQRKARLLEVKPISKDDISEDLKEYDLKKSDGSYYETDSDVLIQLIFLGDKSIPFTTFRSFNSDKYVNFYLKIGKEFDLEVSNN